MASEAVSAINNLLASSADTPDNAATLDVNEFKKNARYGVTVNFDPATASFSIASGTTGDTSSIAITGANAKAIDLMGLAPSDKLTVVASTSEALRGKPSEPAVLRGEALTINSTKSVAITSANKDFLISVDGIAAAISLPFPTTYTNIDAFTTALQDRINAIVDPNTGRKISGVTVGFDTQTKQLSFSTATTGTIQMGDHWVIFRTLAFTACSVTALSPVVQSDLDPTINGDQNSSPPAW